MDTAAYSELFAGEYLAPVFYFCLKKTGDHAEAEELASDISLAVLGNAAFVLFDIAISKLIVLYAFKLRRRFKIDKYIARFR